MEIKDWLERLEAKLDRMDERSDERHERLNGRLYDVDVTLVRQHHELADHTRRSLANEESVALMREEMAARMDLIKHILKQGKPRSTKDLLALIAKATAGLTAAGGVVAGILKALGKI